MGDVIALVPQLINHHIKHQHHAVILTLMKQPHYHYHSSVRFFMTASIAVALAALTASPCNKRFLICHAAAASYSYSKNAGSHHRRSIMTTSATSSSSSSSDASNNNNNNKIVDLWILRHGQATHNPRAEQAREAGCSFETFLDLMRQDDSLDSPLTELGREQARRVHDEYFASSDEPLFDLIVSSPLSRALQTADLAVPPNKEHATQRICLEDFREINGQLLNAKRRSVTELGERFAPQWNFQHLPTHDDTTWQPEGLEPRPEVARRGHAGLRWILEHATANDKNPQVLLVAHGGLLKYTMQDLPPSWIQVVDGRRDSSTVMSNAEDPPPRRRTSCSRFQNCELRRYRMEYDSSSKAELDSNDDDNDSSEPVQRILLTEVNLPPSQQCNNKNNNNAHQ